MQNMENIDFGRLRHRWGDKIEADLTEIVRFDCFTKVPNTSGGVNERIYRFLLRTREIS